MTPPSPAGPYQGPTPDLQTHNEMGANRVKLLGPLDQMFARMETPRTPMHIGAFAIFDLPEGAPASFTRDLYQAISQLEFLPFPFDSARCLTQK